MSAFRRTINLLDKAIDATLAAGLLTIAAILFLQVIQRYGFRAALPWPEELAGFLLVYVSLLGAYRALGSGNHMAFEVVPPGTTKPLLVLLRILAQLLIVVFLLVLVYGGVELVFLAGGQPSTALRLPMSIPYLITPVAAALMTIACAMNIAELASRLRRPDQAASATPGDDRP